MAENNRVADPRPKWLIGVQAEETQPATIEVDGATFIYTVVRPGLEPRLPYVIGFPSQDALFISADVPEEYRRFILAHEIRETTFGQLPEEERCLAALKAELDEVQKALPDKYESYVHGTVQENGFEGRRGFFRALVKLYEDPKQQAAKSQQFIEGIQKSQTYLESLLIA